MSDEWVSRLRDLLEVDLETGRLFWRERTMECANRSKLWNARYAGKEAFTAKDQHGYLVGQVDGKMMKAHRVVFALINGFIPKEIDHNNRNPSDNRPDNLREASRAGNCRNTRVAFGSSGYRGVQSVGNKWAAKIRDGQRQIHLGRFNTEVEAALAYDRAAMEAHGSFASLNFPRGLTILENLIADLPAPVGPKVDA